MIDDFIRDTLAHVDDLTELKVCLVALRLLELKQSSVASVTREELAEHVALKHGLGIVPDIALEAALQRATARGTLLVTTAINPQHPRYFANNDASRAAIEALEATMGAQRVTGQAAADAIAQTLALLGREIERLEAIEAYPAAERDAALVREWLAQGYTAGELTQAVRDVLSVPRRKSAPSRSLESCAEAVGRTPPTAPSLYHQTMIARVEPPGDEVVAFRELARRSPNGPEFEMIRTAAGLFGAHATIQALRRTVSRDRSDVSGLIALLAEEEEAQLALSRDRSEPDAMLRQIVQLYEAAFGLPPTSHVANDINSLAGEITDLAVWQGAFQYAANQNKRDWGYVRKILLNPSPLIFLPAPVNEAAQFAFAEYRRRVGRGVLDPAVARDINDIAQKVTDQAQWTRAFDAAANANALNWNYLKKVLTAPPNKQQAGESKVRSGKYRQTPGARRPGLIRRPQVEEANEAERAAARERARQRIEERARRKSDGGQSGRDGA